VRTRAILGSALAAFGLLAIGWEIGAAAGAGPATTATTSSGGTTDSGSSSPPTTSGSGSGSGTASGGSSTTATTPTTTDGTYTGGVARTRFGDVQVQVTISGGQISDVTALHLTDAESRSVQISNRAAPILRQEVLDAQSTNVQMVGGATYTSDGYLSSLQSALDQAGWPS